MANQGDLYLGVRVDSRKEAVAILKRLGVAKPHYVADGKGEWFQYVEWAGTHFHMPIGVHFDEEEDGEGKHDWSGAVLGFQLTGRYGRRVSALEDHYAPAGVSAEGPIAIDPAMLARCLEFMRQTWPEAQILLLTTHY